jgi:SPFH domain / Band 7 family
VSTPEILAPRRAHSQRSARAVPGALAAIVAAAAVALGIVLVFVVPVAGVVVLVLAAVGLRGFVIVQPNSSRVLILFGRYTGTLTEPGPWWVNPFTSFWRRTVSLRVRNFQSERIKVNDASGNPIEIAAVVVWRVTDTARAIFDVEDYEQFVVVQSETAVRHLASLVAGAVGIVQMALAELADSDLIELDPERKAAMVSNLMVVLSGDHAPTPVLNTGSLYT